MVAKTKKGGGESSGLLWVLFVLLLASLGLALSAYMLQTRHLANTEQYLLHTGEQRILAHKIAGYASESLAGQEAAFDRLKDSRKEFSRLMDELKSGVPGKNLPSAPESVQPQLQGVQSIWLELRSQVDAILNNQEAILSVRGTIDDLRSTLPGLREIFTSVAVRTVEAKASQARVYHATRQLFIAQRMDTSLNQGMTGGSVIQSEVDRLYLDLDEMKTVTKALLEGDAALGVEPVEDEIVQQKLVEISAILGGMGESLGMLQQSAMAGEQLQPDMDVQVELEGISDRLSRKLAELRASYSTKVSNPMLGPVEVKPELITLTGAVAIALMLILGLVLIANAKKRARVAAELDQGSDEAMRRLLDEMSGLADGDLSVETTVSEGLTGAVAKSVNQAVAAMRGSVSAIQDTSIKLYSSVQENRATILQLAEVSEHQREQITDVSSTINTMAQDLTAMTSDAASSSETVEKLVGLAARGGDAVRQTISGMNKIGDRVEEASVHIQRLDENLREAGDMVELIEDIADQTNILGLNAAMQAAVAGEAGRGFVVVADGVQRQAERFASVTKQIEAMVQSIQAEANKAVKSMEFSAAEVASGASLSENAGKLMEQIEVVSRDISSTVSRFAESVQQQSRSAVGIDDSMGIIREITRQNSENTDASVLTIGELAENIDNLRESVAGFALSSRA